MPKLAAFAPAMLAAPLAACQANAPEPGNNAQSVQNELAGLPEGQRNAVFIRAIRDANQDCQHVESSALVGAHQGFPLWSARCAGGRTFTIAIGNAGEAQVIDDAVARLPGNGTAPANAQGD
ncbi:hypothetical protein RCO27_18730 [Sphingosinicella sp. LHD-64]|uniref:hypothetical protein n=1 Tax=Sphingosinicella sp. LHD-64 TaxID=3072139 RepID=UPI00280EAA8F|nr:hypothetical protein [Sphingosinicella sp. LHD-64]MDQ8758269.1 hypothetical protein [Sphingosinicella sp. LHD-64]